MATYTTNLELIKPAGTDKIRIAQINQNMDTIDSAIGPVGNTSLQTQMTAAANSLSAVEDGVAIVSNNNSHAAIVSGQYVYIKNNATLAEGMYVATQNISANGELTLSNVTPVSGGAINDLQSSTNQALATLTYTGTVANLQTSLVSLANSMSIGEFHNIKYTAGETLAPFSNSRIYGGTFKRTGSNYWSVTLEDPEGVPIYGTYKNGRWSWEPLALIKQGAVSVTISDTTNGFIDSGISSSNYMMLSAHTLASPNNCVRISNLSGGNYRFQIISAIDGSVQKSGSSTVYFAYMSRY